MRSKEQKNVLNEPVFFGTQLLCTPFDIHISIFPGIACGNSHLIHNLVRISRSVFLIEETFELYLIHPVKKNKQICNCTKTLYVKTENLEILELLQLIKA